MVSMLVQQHKLDGGESDFYIRPCNNELYELYGDGELEQVYNVKQMSERTESLFLQQLPVIAAAFWRHECFDLLVQDEQQFTDDDVTQPLLQAVLCIRQPHHYYQSMFSNR